MCSCDSDSVTTAGAGADLVAPDTARALTRTLDRSDRLFRGTSRGSGLIILLIMSFIGTFLTVRGFAALKDAGWSFFTAQQWFPDAGHGHFGIAAVMLGTILIGLTAIFFAIPLAIGTALYISEYVPPRLKRTLVTAVDLMAAVPSVVYGLWGFFLLEPHVLGLSQWLSTYLGWFPLFHVNGTDPNSPLHSLSVYTSSTFIAGMCVSLMVTPIVSSVMREAFSQAPPGEREAAYALGGTRWGMIRTVVLPFGRGGMIGGTMLGLGRALGETITVYMIISFVLAIQPHLLQNGGSSVSALIALRYGDASAFGTSALMAAGLALFVLTMIVNFIASSIVARSRSGAESEV
jgi:phosphate transport system permease protein